MNFSRRTLCIFCAIAAAIIGLMLALAPFPLSAQDKAANAAQFADKDEKDLREVEGRVSLLGGGQAMANFKLLVLAHLKTGGFETPQNADLTTDKDGKYLLRLGKNVTRARLFSYGEFFIPDGMSNVPLGNMKFAARETWDVQVRPLRHVPVTGTVKLANGKAASRASVYLAPLDLRPDGSAQVFEEPYSAVADEHGRYRFEAPTGYFRLWAYWTDKDSEAWDGYLGMVRRIDVFDETHRDLTVTLGEHLAGRVTDARDGKGLVAWIDLYSNAYQRQLRNPTADGEIVDERVDGKDIRWPVGDFKFRLVTVDPENFTAVIRPRWNNSAMRVFSGLKAADLIGKRIEWKMFTPDQIQVDLLVQTHQRELPVHKLDVRVQAVKLDDPNAIRALYTLGGETDDEGGVSFLGLAPGQYTVYGEQGTMVLGELRVTGELRQSAQFKLEIPFATGKLKYEDGTVCKHALCVMKAEIPGRGSLGARFVEPFPSKALREKGVGLIPLTLKGAVFTLRFYANHKDQEGFSDEWMPEDFPMWTDEVKFTVDAEKAYDYELTLKAQPKKEPRDG